MSEKDQFHQQNDLFHISSSNLTRFQTFSIELGLLQYISHVLIIIGFILIEFIGCNNADSHDEFESKKSIESDSIKI